MSNPLPKFYQHLLNAAGYREDVDNFNLISGSPASVKEWKILLKEEKEAVVDLVDYVQKHGDQVIAWLNEST